MSRNCQLGLKCAKYKGLHHISICRKPSGNETMNESHEATSMSVSSLNPQAPPFQDTCTHTMLYAECSNQVLLQTARAPLFNPLRPNKQIVAQFVLDPGSQRSESVRKQLGLRSDGKKKMSIMTFGSTEGEPRECHVVRIGIQLKHGGNCELPVLTVPLICDDLEATTVQLCILTLISLM